jgi:hypothetical protein
MKHTLADLRKGRIGKPKPAKSIRKKKHVHGICPQCGTIFHSKTSEHAPGCEKEIAVIMVRKRQTDRQLLNMALDQLCRMLTTWRDGCSCVLVKFDGGRCGGVSQWGHVVPQGSCSYLVHELSNSFRQCENHNGIHRFVQLPFHVWYKDVFGEAALSLLDKSRQEHVSYKFGIVELREKLAHLNFLYQSRFTVGLRLKDLVSFGYYGEIIKEAWKKEGKP